MSFIRPESVSESPCWTPVAGFSCWVFQLKSFFRTTGGNFQELEFEAEAKWSSELRLTTTSWQQAAGSWQLATGSWQLAASNWKEPESSPIASSIFLTWPEESTKCWRNMHQSFKKNDWNLFIKTINTLVETILHICVNWIYNFSPLLVFFSASTVSIKLFFYNGKS